MMEPKYDEENVTYGFFKKMLGTDSKNISSYPILVKNYVATPNPPYNEGDTWSNNNQVYRCVKTRKMGNFNKDDWIVLYNDKTKELLNNNLKFLKEVELLDTKREKVETFYQKDEPSKNWNTDDIRSDHIGDYYQNSLTFKTYRYEYSDNSYVWKEIDTINTIFDNITGHKNIFLKQPTTYYENDLFKISKDNLDIFPNSVNGDFYKAIKNNTIFNKEDFVKVSDELSIKANLYSNVGYKISENNILGNLQFTSFGKHNGFEILGFDKWYDVNGIVRGYSNVFLNVNIPKNFKILSAFLTIYHSPVFWHLYNDYGNGKDVVGTSRNIKLFKVKRSETFILKYENNSSYFYDPSNNPELEEIPNAFGASSYTPTNKTLKSLESKTTNDIKNYLNKEGNTTLVLKVDAPIPGDYDDLFACGMAMANIDILGYLEGGKDV